jgi:hypothetical protein
MSEARSATSAGAFFTRSTGGYRDEYLFAILAWVTRTETIGHRSADWHLVIPVLIGIIIRCGSTRDSCTAKKSA